MEISGQGPRGGKRFFHTLPGGFRPSLCGRDLNFLAGGSNGKRHTNNSIISGIYRVVVDVLRSSRVRAGILVAGASSQGGDAGGFRAGIGRRSQRAQRHDSGIAR